MSLIMISACVERLLTLTNKIQDHMKTFKCFLNDSNMVNIKLLTYTHLVLVFALVMVTFFFIPAGIFSYVEESWDYLDGLYYCFISLTTIGLGDFIPGDNHAQPYRAYYKIATTFYLIIGVMFVMLLLNVVTQIPELNVSKLFALEINESNDPERQLLAANNGPSNYSRQLDEDDTASTLNPPQIGLNEEINGQT